MYHIHVLTQRTYAFLLLTIFFFCTASAQTSTVTFTSTNPADGQTPAWTYCGVNGWMSVSSNYCGQNISPAFSSNMNSSGIMFLAIDVPGFGKAVNYPMTGGNFLLFTENTGTTPDIMSGFIIRSTNNGSNPVDIASVQIYQESGSAVNFTFTGGTTYRGSDLGSIVSSVPSGVVTTVNLQSAGFYGFNTVEINPATNIIFGVSSFEFSDTAFPVEWSYFQASQEKSTINLNWATHQEVNTSHFDVQRKLPGGEAFETIGSLEAAGNSDELKAYQFTDYAPQTGSIQYRIRQVDLDGAYSFSKVEEVRMESVISLSPNPTNGRLAINTSDQSWFGRVLDLQGKVLRDIPSVQSELDLSDLPAGMYIVDLYNGSNQRITEKIIKN